MGKICAWCGTVIRVATGHSMPVSHSLCGSCLDELQQALSTQGLKPAREPHPTK